VNMVYSQLLQYKFGPGVPVPNLSVTTDLAESFDQPDERTYVFKLRGGVKYQNLPPVNGRELVAEDVVKSFERQVAEKANGAALVGTKVEAPDKQTVKITLDTPNADFLWSLADSSVRIVPPETWAVKGDLKEGPIVGSGPWMFNLADWQKGTQFPLRKNPDYFQKGNPYVDSVSFFHLTDTQTMINALRSGNLEAIGVGVTHADLEPAKREAPDL